MATKQLCLKHRHIFRLMFDNNVSQCYHLTVGPVDEISAHPTLDLLTWVSGRLLNSNTTPLITVDLLSWGGRAKV